MTLEEFIVADDYQFQKMTMLTNEAYLEDSEYKYHEASTDTQYVWCGDLAMTNDLFISFRGTESMRDLITDCQCDMLTPAYGNEESRVRVHSGFYLAYLSVRESILRRFENVRTDATRLFISGHSLGGALALLCALDIQYHHPATEIFLLTIGQPKVGNRSFAESTNRRLSNYFRIVNGDDIVPKIPFTYSHAGQLTEVGEQHWWKPASLEDHFRANYIRRLLAMVE
jgi:predicted lipase